MSALAKKPPATTRMRVDLACNDGDNGLFEGSVRAIHVFRLGESIDFDLLAGRPPKLTLLEERIRLFRREFATYSSAEWVGNWCWNSYVLSLADVAELIHRALASRKFGCDGASGNIACALAEQLDDPFLPADEIAGGLARFGAPK